MTEVHITPKKDKPVPYDTEDEIPASLKEDLAISGNTAELQERLGAGIDLPPEDIEAEKKLIASAIANKKLKTPLSQNSAFAAAAFLRAYGAQLALDVAAARAAITNKLMELANCGDPRFELKALELLGKHSDIGIFTDRSEVTINYKNPEALEEAIKERVKRLLNAEMVDITPLGVNLDEELGVLKLEKRPEQKEVQEEKSRNKGKKLAVLKDFKDLPADWGSDAKKEKELVK